MHGETRATVEKKNKYKESQRCGFDPLFFEKLFFLFDFIGDRRSWYERQTPRKLESENWDAI